MPTQPQIASLQQRSRMVHSAMVKAAYTYMGQGGYYSDWNKIFAIRQLNIALDTQVRAEDFISDDTLVLYKTLQRFVGSQFIDPISLDPNAQIPGSPIIVVSNPVSPDPEPSIPYSDFDASTQDENGGRTILPKPSWRGFNPVLSLIMPAETALTLGEDYRLNAGGGIQLLISGNVPVMNEGMRLRATSFVPVT